MKQKQRKMKAFVDRHQKSKEKLFDIGKPVLVFQIHVSYGLHKWLKTNGLEGYIQIVEAEPHPQAAKVVKEFNVDKISNQQVRQNLKKEGYNIMDSLETEVLESYFGPYSPSTKLYQTYGGKDVSFMMSRIGCGCRWLAGGGWR